MQHNHFTFINKAITHYELLGLPSHANEIEIKKAYHHEAKIWHPDKAKEWLPKENYADAEMIFKKIQHAYEVLTDLTQRAEYDKHHMHQVVSEQEKQWIAKWIQLKEKYLRENDPQTYYLTKEKQAMENALKEKDLVIKALQTKLNKMKVTSSFQSNTYTAKQPSNYSANIFSKPSKTLDTKMLANGLQVIYKVFERLGISSNKMECNSIALVFQNESQASQFKLLWRSTVKQNKDLEFFFKNHKQKLHLLYAVFDKPNLLSHWCIARGEKMLEEFSKYIQIDRVQKENRQSSLFDYSPIKDSELPSENKSYNTYNHR